MSDKQSAPRNSSSRPLQRGNACLPCRRGKLKCDGKKPSCEGCLKRDEYCEYDNKQQKSRTQKLRATLMALQERIQQLEAGQSQDEHTRAGHPEYLNANNIGRTGNSDAYAPPWFDTSSYTDIIPPPFLPTPSQDHSSGSASPDHPTVPQHIDDPNESLTPEHRKLLLDTFIVHKYQCGYDGDVERFSPDTARRPEPDPALLNAIYLVACYFAKSPSFSGYEPIFYSRTLHGITISLDRSERLLDIVQASCLLAVYLYANNRNLEGYCHAFSAARLAVGLGLHQLKPFGANTQEADLAPIRTSPPKDAWEHRERVATFWQVFTVDRCWSVANGLPIALPDGDGPSGKITTPYLGPLTDGLTPSSPPLYIPTLRVQAAELFERTYRLTSVTLQSQAHETEYQKSHYALQHLMNMLPPVQKESDSWGWCTYVDLAVIHTLAHLAMIHLEKDDAEKRHAVIGSAISVTTIIQQLAEDQYEFLDPILSTCWFTVANLWIDWLRPQETMRSSHASIEEIKIIMSALHTFQKFVPLAGEYYARLEDECQDCGISVSPLMNGVTYS